jgi:hypothetical protein
MKKLNCNLLQPKRLRMRRRRRVDILKIMRMRRETMKDRIKPKIWRRRRMEDLFRNTLKIPAHQLIHKNKPKMAISQNLLLNPTRSQSSLRKRRRLNLPLQPIMKKLQSHLVQSKRERKRGREDLLQHFSMK